MRHFILGLILLTLLAAPALAQDDPSSNLAKPKSLIEKVSYSIGLRLGGNFAGDGVEVDLSWLTKGIQDGLKEDAKPLIDEKEQKEAMVAFQKELEAKKKSAGEKFLAANKKKDGVKTTDSGLQYKVLNEGKGASPKETDTVKVHYHGTLINGKVFDSSVERGEPAQFPVNRVIKGWTEALQLMKVGDKFQLVIPSDLAYGERGAGGDIGPHSVLVFEVELLDIVK